jgi:hypothetical protein
MMGLIGLLCIRVSSLCESGTLLIENTIKTAHISDKYTGTNRCVIVRNSLFLDISAGSYWGGAFEVGSGTAIDASDSSWINCKTGGYGGIISAQGSWTSMIRCCGILCSGSMGGNFWAGYSTASRLWLEESSLSECTPSSQSSNPGGVIFHDSWPAMHHIQCNFTDSYSRGSGAVVLYGAGAGRDVLQNAFVFQMIVRCSANGIYKLKNQAGSSFEFCSFIYCEAKTTTNGFIMADSSGDISVMNCLFKECSGVAFCRTSSAGFRVRNCKFDKAIPSSFSGAGVSEMINIHGEWTDTLTISRKDLGSCMVLYVISDVKDPTIGTGKLWNEACLESAMEYQNQNWGSNLVNYDRPISGNGDTYKCCKFRKCTFSEISSKDANGGAISFSVTGASVAQFDDCHFALCFTSKTVTSFSGGAIYLSVQKAYMNCMCGSECVAYTGTFASITLPISDSQVQFECSETSIHKCGTQGSFTNSGGGVSIDVDASPFELRNVNFSDCLQNSQASTLRQRSRTSTIPFPEFAIYVTCLRCYGSSCFSISFQYYVTFYSCVFINNDVSSDGALFESVTSSLCMALRLCYFVRWPTLVKSLSGILYVDIYDCAFKNGVFIDAFTSCAISFLRNVKDQTNEATINAFRSSLCHQLFWMRTASFSESIKFTKTNAFSSTVCLPKTGVMSQSSSFNSTIAFSPTKPYTKTGALSTSASFSLTNCISQSSFLKMSAKLSFSLSFSPSSAPSESNLFSMSKTWSDSSLMEKSEKFSVSITFSVTSRHCNSLRFSISDAYSHSEKEKSSQDLSLSMPFDLTSFFIKSNAVSSSSECNSETKPELIETINETRITSLPTQILVVPGSTILPVPTQMLMVPGSTILPVPTQILMVPRPTNLPVPTQSPKETLYPASTELPDATIFAEGTPLQTNFPRSTVRPLPSDYPKSTDLPLATETPQTTVPQSVKMILTHESLGVSSRSEISWLDSGIEAPKERAIDENENHFFLTMIIMVMLVVFSCLFAGLLHKESERHRRKSAKVTVKVPEGKKIWAS